MSKDIAKILFVEDDINFSILLKNFLEGEGFLVRLCGDGESGYREFKKNYNEYDLCILDCMLPLKDGFKLASEIKSMNKKTPIIFLTARSMKEDKIKGFSIGIDDYITKPFDEEELLLRIKAILRRTVAEDVTLQKKSLFKIGKYTFDHSNQTIIIKNYSKRITKKESEILWLLCLHKNRLLKKGDILIKVWGENDYFLGRSLDVFITKIRKYLKDDPDISIENVHNVGFILNDKKNQDSISQ